MTSACSCSTARQDELVIEGLDEPAGALGQPRLLRAGRASRPTAAPPISPSSPADDDDPFARYEAMQQLMLDTLIAGGRHGRGGARAGDRGGARDPDQRRRSIRPSSPRRCCCRARPSSATICSWSIPRRSTAPARRCAPISAATLESLWRDAYATHVANRYEYNPAAKGARRLRTIALGYIAAAGAADAPALARAPV